MKLGRHSQVALHLINMDFNISANKTLQEDQTTYLEILAWTGFAIAVASCNGLAIAIIYHERFGGDPQKRSLANRLTSNMFLAFTLSTDSQVLGLVLNKTNSLSDPFIIRILQIDRAFFFANFSFMNLHTLVIYVQVIIFNRVKEINDELCDTCLRRSVYFGSFWTSFLMPMDRLMLDGFRLVDPDICWNVLFEPGHQG